MQKIYDKLTNGLTALYCTRPIRLNNNKTLTANRLRLSRVTAHRGEYTNICTCLLIDVATRCVVSKNVGRKIPDAI